MQRLLAAIGGLACLGSALADEPPDVIPQARHPDHVLIRLDGSAEVIFGVDQTRLTGPAKLPVYTELEDGDRTRGALILRGVVPRYVVRSNDGSLSVEVDGVSTRFCGNTPGADRAPARAALVRTVWPGSDWIEVVPEGRIPPGNVPLRGAWDLSFQINPQEPPPAGVPMQLVGRAMQRIENRLEGILAGNAGVVVVSLGWRDFGGDPNAASSNRFFLLPGGQNPSYALVRQNLNVFAEADMESPGELNLYDALPLGATVPVRFPMGAAGSSASIRLYTPTAQKWDLPVVAGADLLVFFDLQVFDFNADNGINPNQRDFEQILFHEVVHGLGFRSVQADFEQSPTVPYVSVLDLFRLGTADVGTAVDFNEFRGADRMLQIGASAITVTQLGIGLGTQMTTGIIAPGDGWEGDHWKQAQDRTPPSADWIGIMDPATGLGERRFVPGYLSSADLAALDIVGWNMESPELFGPPDPSTLSQPGKEAMGVPVAPTLVWSPGAGATAQDVYVFSLPAQSDGTQVFAVTGLSGGATSAVIPGGTLRPGRSYTWFVTSHNDYAFDYSEARAFSTAGCSADWDANGTVNSTDISAFLTTWLQDTQSGGVSADFDYSGAVNSSDISAHLTAWLSQVEANCGF